MVRKPPLESCEVVYTFIDSLIKYKVSYEEGLATGSDNIRELREKYHRALSHFYGQYYTIRPCLERMINDTSSLWAKETVWFNYVSPRVSVIDDCDRLRGEKLASVLLQNLASHSSDTVLECTNEMFSRGYCVVHDVRRSNLILDITLYYDYYKRFENDTTSDLQLLYIKCPETHGRGKLIYWNSGMDTAYKQGGGKKGDKELLMRSRDVSPGRYVGFCDKMINTSFYYFLFIKHKEQLIFRYEGLNLDVTELDGNDQRFRQVIQMIKLLQ